MCQGSYTFRLLELHRAHVGGNKDKWARRDNLGNFYLIYYKFITLGA